MKISFQSGDEPQKPVTNNQVEMKQAKVRRLPVLRVLILLVVLLGIAYFTYDFMRDRAVYTYGLVSGKYDEKIAPARSVITKMVVHPGDQVKKGQVLYQAVADEEIPQLESVRAGLSTLRHNLDELKKKDSAYPGLAQQRESLRQLQSSLKDAQALADNPGQADKDSDARAELEIKQAEEEVQKLEGIFIQKNKRWEDLKKMFELGAAVKSDVATAEQERNHAKHNLQQAVNTLDFARTNKPVYKEKHALDRKANEEKLADLRERVANQEAEFENIVKREEQALRRNIALAEQNVAYLEKLTGQAIAVSLFDGVVTDIRATEGATVEAGTRIMTVQDVRGIWIETYIADEDMKKISAGKKARIYSLRGSDSCEGTVESIGSEKPLPSELAPHLKKQGSGVYCRISFIDEHQFRPGNIVKIIIR